MVYANPAPAGMASGQFYDTEGADYYLSPAKLESDYADVRFERELKLFRKFCPRGAVLDVGCGSGAFLFQLKKRWAGDYETLGTDVSGAPLDYAESRGVPVVRGNFLEQEFGIRANLEMPKTPHSVPPLEPPPHPACGHPLPRSERGRGQGEGALRGSGVQSANFGSGKSLPIRWGEGRGEGNPWSCSSEAWPSSPLGVVAGQR
jgi:ribosomal protein S27AE